jgi:hypothetical protein
MEPSYGFRSSLSAGNLESFDGNTPVDQAQHTVGTCLRARPLFTGNYYPLFAPTSELHRWFGYQLHRADLNKGMALVFRRARCPQTETTVLLHRIDLAKTYRLADQETGKTRERQGKELQTLLVEVTNAPGSRLLFYEQK